MVVDDLHHLTGVFDPSRQVVVMAVAVRARGALKYQIWELQDFIEGVPSVHDQGWVELNFGVPTSFLTTQPLMLNSYQPM